jgi:hypothetical protein
VVDPAAAPMADVVALMVRERLTGSPTRWPCASPTTTRRPTTG